MVRCGAAGTSCDHLDCHGGPFVVVFVGIDRDEMFVYIYTSEDDAWSRVAASSAVPPDGGALDEALPGVLAARGLYFAFLDETSVLEYDPAMASMSVIPLPPRPNGRRIVLMPMDDGARLGFAEVQFWCTLTLWAMEADPEGNPGGWVQRRVINLKAHFPRRARALRSLPNVVAFANIVGVIFLRMADGLYTLDLNTGKAVKVMSSAFDSIVPYLSYYTPVLRPALATSGEGSVGASTSA